VCEELTLGGFLVRCVRSLRLAGFSSGLIQPTENDASPPATRFLLWRETERERERQRERQRDRQTERQTDETEAAQTQEMVSRGKGAMDLLGL
jgi:hypothetical protein